MKIAGFHRDDGNWPKCGKHGVTPPETEGMLLGAPAVEYDPFPAEGRMCAIGKTPAGRHLFVVFVLREMEGGLML